MALLAALVIGLIALIITPGYLFYFDITPKIAVLLVGTAVLLIAAMRRRDLPRGPRWFAILLLANAGSLALSTAFSSNRALSLYGSTWRSFGAVTQVVAMLFAWLVAWECTGRPDRARVLLRGVSITGTVAAAYGVAQYFGWDPWLPQASYRVGEGFWSIVRPPGTLGYASYFATWLLVSVFLSLALSKMESQRVWQVIAWSAAGLSGIAMVLTGTRAAILGLIVGVAVWLWWSGFRLPRRASLAALTLVVCGAAFYYSPLGHQLRSRTRWFVEDPWGGARPLLWRDSLMMGLRRPLAGYGPEVFLSQFPIFESKVLARAYPDFVHESPHNVLLDALVSQGLPGFLILCGLFGAGFTAAWKLKQMQKSSAGWLAAAVAAGVVSQQFTAFTMPTAVLFLTTIALVAGLAAEATEPRPYRLMAGVAPFLVLAMLYLAFRVTIADHDLQLTRTLMDTGDLRATTAQYERYWFWRLPGSNADLWYSRNWMNLARRTPDALVLEQALVISLQSARRATDFAEEPFAAWYNLAQISALRDDSQATEESLQRSIASHPNWFKAHWMLAQEFRVMGRLEDAEKEAAVAVDLDGGHHPEVAQTLRDIQSHSGW